MAQIVNSRQNESAMCAANPLWVVSGPFQFVLPVMQPI